MVNFVRKVGYPSFLTKLSLRIQSRGMFFINLRNFYFQYPWVQENVWKWNEIWKDNE